MQKGRGIELDVNTERKNHSKPIKTVRKIISEIILIIMTVVVWIPIYYFMIGAFKTNRGIVLAPLVINAEWFSLENFAKAIERVNFFQSLFNTGIITLSSILLIIIFGSLSGFAIARIKKRGFRVFYAITIALMVVPFIGVIISLIKLINSIGLYGSIWSAILIQTAWNLPFGIFLYTGFIRALPKELEEAAYVDGCSMFRTYYSIFLPLLAPVTATCAIRSSIGIWNDFLVSMTMLNSSNTPTLMVSVQQFFGERSNEYGMAFAAILLASLPIMIMFLFLQKYFIKGIAAGAVKG